MQSPPPLVEEDAKTIVDHLFYDEIIILPFNNSPFPKVRCLFNKIPSFKLAMLTIKHAEGMHGVGLECLKSKHVPLTCHIYAFWK